MILLSEDIRKAKEDGKFLACAYCGSKEIEKIKETDSIKECFKNNEKMK